MKVALLFPPQWTAAQPYYGLATLNGQLRSEGHETTVHDLNLDFVERAHEPQMIRFAKRRLQNEQALLATEATLRLATGDRSDLMAQQSKKLLEVDRYLDEDEDIEDLAERAQWALETLRDRNAFYDPHQLVAAMLTTDEVLKLHSLPYFPAEIRWNNFSTPTVPLNLEPMIEFCRDPVVNPFRRFYESRIPAILDQGADMVAVSINSFSQVLPGLTLAMMLREAGAPHISLGGNFFSRLKDALMARPEFFETFGDTLILGEGERPLVELARWLEGGSGAPDSVSNLLYLDAAGQRVCYTGEAPNYAMDELAYQDLTGFPLDRYLSADLVVCTRLSKGCYYGKCAFCDSYYGLDPDTAKIERLVGEMRHLKATFGVRNFELVDQCIAPDLMRRLCLALIEADLDVRWFCNGRTETGFTAELLELVRSAGGTMIMWGVESGSRRVLKLMKKGVSPKARMDVLRNASDAGLWNFGYIFFGFPTETAEEAAMTVELIAENTDVIHSYGRSVFTLGKHAPLFDDLDRYGISSWVEDDEEFSTNLSYQVDSGIGSGEVSEVAQRGHERWRKAYDDPLWMALRSRENLHLYLAHHGKPWVHDFDMGGADVTSEDFVF